MNYIAHYHLALAREQSPEFNFGAFSPDLIGIGGGRVTRVKDRTERACLPDGLQEFQRGVDFHYAVDTAYDQLDEVHLLNKYLRDEILSKRTGYSRGVSLLLGAVATDLLIDAHLLRKEPSLEDDVKKAIKVSQRFNPGDISTDPHGLVHVLGDFGSRIPAYEKNNLVARLVFGMSYRRLRRPFPLQDLGTIMSVVKEYRPLVDEKAPDIMRKMTKVTARLQD